MVSTWTTAAPGQMPPSARRRVFNAGTTHPRTWGLDDVSFEPHRFTFADSRLQQLTANTLDRAATKL